MKNVPCFAATLLLSAVLVANTRADGSVPQPPSASDTLALQDPDGVPLVISHPKDAQPSQSQIDAERRREQQADANKDWLLKGYEKQLQLRAAKEPGSQDNNLYYRIASDKKLSQMAGVSKLDAAPADAASAFRTGASTSGNTALGLRSDSSTGLTSPVQSSLLTPLITPLGAADAAGLHNFFGPSPSQAPATPTQNTATAQDPADLEIPGKVAAESDPLAKDTLTFASDRDDALPDKISAHDDGSKDQLPLSTNAERLQRLTDTALSVPGVVKTVQPTNNLAALQLKLASDPPPTKLPAPSPVRQPISNPFSILDR